MNLGIYVSGKQANSLLFKQPETEYETSEDQTTKEEQEHLLNLRTMTEEEKKLEASKPLYLKRYE